MVCGLFGCFAVRHCTSFVEWVYLKINHSPVGAGGASSQMHWGLPCIQCSSCSLMQGAS